MKAIIIAAGMGNRLGSLTEDRPKGMVQVGGKELILRAMDFLSAGDFSERIVIVGYHADEFSSFLQENCPGVRIIVNPDYKLGSVRTIEKALPYLDEPFLLMNVDHVYPRRMFPALPTHHAGLAAICDTDRELAADDMKVKLNGDRKIARIAKTLEEFDAGYIGMTWCGAHALDSYREAVGRTLETQGDSANVEAILAELAGEGHDIDICDLSGMGWLEVDTQQDLTHAEQVLRAQPEFLA
jgi:choline kinase